MLNLPLGGRVRFCDGISRRNFLKVGTFSFGAATLTLADILRAEAAAQPNPYPRTGHKALINIFLGGGPPHQDMWDIKTEAPKEIRGEFKPINTKVTGIQIGETFKKIAGMADKFAFIRSVIGARGGHDAVQCTTGWAPQSLSTMGGRPSIGSVSMKLQGSVDPSVPPFIGMAEKTQHGPWSDPGQTGFLGSTFSPFKPSGPDMANMVLNAANKDQLPDRKKLLAGFDDLKREMDHQGGLKGADAHTARAFDVLTSSRLVEALDISKESQKTRDRYGDGKPYQFQYDGAPTVNEQLLMARRLVEAGARVVTLSYGRWDSHGQNFALVRDHGAKLDQCLTALVEDLDVRGMLDDVTVIAWGEFGRTPQINGGAGRDHWQQVSCAILAGGGMKTGQVIGSTDRNGGNAKDRPVEFGEIFATLYQNLGLNPETTTITDPTGRPQHLAEGKACRNWCDLAARGVALCGASLLARPVVFPSRWESMEPVALIRVSCPSCTIGQFVPSPLGPDGAECPYCGVWSARPVVSRYKAHLSLGSPEWELATDSRQLLAVLRVANCVPSQRKARLACCAAVRLIGSGAPRAEVKEVIEYAERWADTGVPPPNVPGIIAEHTGVAALAQESPREQLQARLAGLCLSDDCRRRFWFWWCYGHMEFHPRTAFANAYRELFPNPFVPLEWNPEWFTSTVRDLAAHIYEQREFHLMPILGDALMDAGCDHQLIQDHCRTTKPHARGCWIVDAILGKS